MQRLEPDAGKLARPVLWGPGGSNAIRLPDQALETKARFISQVMTGESVARRAEDIGGQELSYAEVKAIASGNPAVLTLADADAELQRLAILKRNHNDEQYLASRALRDLPETIARLKGRLENLSADHATAVAHERDPITVGDRSDDAPAALGRRLDALPETVRETKRFPLGRYRGLAFGLVLHPGGAADVYLEGAATRHGMLSRDHRGPRAVLNALDRLAGGYQAQCEAARQDLAIAEGQLRDHEARIGRPFPHDAYRAELTGLRDRLKAGLSQTTPEPGTEALPVAELADRIKALKAAHTIDAPPERTAARRIAAEEPVTARIRRRTGSAPAIEPPAVTEHATPLVGIPAAEAAPSARHAEPEQAIKVTSPRPHTDYRQHIAHERGRKERQLGLF